MFWWYFIIGCDGQICHPPRKLYHNWGVAKWVLWCFLLCFQFWILLDRALCFDDISSLDVMVRSVLPLGSGTPTVVACTRFHKIWLTHQTKNWKQGRVLSFIPLRTDWHWGSMVACMKTATFKCRNVSKWVLIWFLLCVQFWRLLDRALCFDDISSLDVMVRSAIPLGSCTTTGVLQSEYFDVFSCVSSFGYCWIGPYVLMIFHHWMWW